jgi:2-dehydropantoate 2-reductase
MLASPRGPRVTIFGTGALACALGARLARFGRAAVTLAGTWPKALDAIGAHGVVVDEANAVWSARVSAVPLAGPLGPADFVLVLVKSHQTESVARTAARCLLPASRVVTLQAGLGNREVLEAASGVGRVSQGLAFLTASLLGPGEVQVAPGRIVLGREPAPAVAGVADLLRESRLQVETSDELDRLIWTRLAVDCSVGPLAALTGRPNGALLETPEPCESLLKAAREVGAVASAKGLDFGDDPGSLAAEAAESTAAQRAAMLRDLDRGARTEIDALCGMVVSEGRSLGVPTPVNDYLWRRVREKEGRPAS